MRRPVGVKWIRFWFSLDTMFSPAEWPLSPCFHPHSRGAIRFARCMLGVLVSAGAAICLAPCGSALAESNLGQAINAVTGTRLWLLSFSSWNGFVFYAAAATVVAAAVVQRFVHFSAHPQVMQQHRQLSRGRHDGSLLAVSSATFGQLQAPAPRSQSTPNGPRMCCAPCTSSVRR